MDKFQSELMISHQNGQLTNGDYLHLGIETLEITKVSVNKISTVIHPEDRASVFLQASDTSDMRLVIEGRPLYVSRVVLSLISPVLKEEFDNQSRQKSVVELSLPGRKFDEILEFLCCVYPDFLKPISDENVSQMLKLAVELRVTTLHERCEKFLLDELMRNPKNLAPDKLVLCMQLAEKYNLEDVKNLSFDIATRTSSDLLENVEGFWNLPHVVTSGIFVQRLKLFEQAGKKISKRLNEAETHCSLYHKNERWGDTLCNKCMAGVGKVAATEITQL